MADPTGNDFASPPLFCKARRTHWFGQKGVCEPARATVASSAAGAIGDSVRSKPITLMKILFVRMDESLMAGGRGPRHEQTVCAAERRKASINHKTNTGCRHLRCCPPWQFADVADPRIAPPTYERTFYAKQPSSNDLDRREMLGTMGLAAAAGLTIAGAVSAAAVVPAAGVEDRGADQSQPRGIPCGPKTFLKIETDKNITGWGEVTGCEPNVAAALAHSMFELLDGENPTRIEHLWQKYSARTATCGGGPFMVHTHLRHRHGLVGHRGQALGRSRLPALGGPCATRFACTPGPRQERHGRPASSSAAIRMDW